MLRSWSEGLSLISSNSDKQVVSCGRGRLVTNCLITWGGWWAMEVGRGWCRFEGRGRSEQGRDKLKGLVNYWWRRDGRERDGKHRLKGFYFTLHHHALLFLMLRPGWCPSSMCTRLSQTLSSSSRPSTDFTSFENHTVFSQWAHEHMSANPPKHPQSPLALSAQRTQWMYA